MTVAARSSILLYNDALQDAKQYTARTLDDETSDGIEDLAAPVENLLDPVISRVWRRTSLVPGHRAFLQLQVTLPALQPIGAAAIVLAGVRAVTTTGGYASPLEVTCRISSTSIGATDIYTAIWRTRAAPLVGTPCATFVFGGQKQIASRTAARQRADGGLIPVPPSLTLYVQAEIRNNTAQVVDIEAGRLLMMSGFWCGQDPQGLTYGVADDSEVTTAFDGTAYSTRRIPLRTVSGTISGLRRHEVHGGLDPETPSGGGRISTIGAINYLSGRTGPVLYYPRTPFVPGLLFSATDCDAWTSEGVLGLLEQPLTATLRTGVFNGQDELYSTQFRIRELAGKA